MLVMQRNAASANKEIWFPELNLPPESAFRVSKEPFADMMFCPFLTEVCSFAFLSFFCILKPDKKRVETISSRCVRVVRLE